MKNQSPRPGAPHFIALDVALQIVRHLRVVVDVVRRHEPSLASQIVRSASSVAANLAEGNGRAGRDRVYHFRVACGSAQETRAHLNLALAWGWVDETQIAPALALLDQELAMLWKLTR